MAVSLEDIDRRLEQVEKLLARLVDCVLAVDEPGDYFDPTLLARDIFARGSVAMKEHNQRRNKQFRQSQNQKRKEWQRMA